MKKYFVRLLSALLLSLALLTALASCGGGAEYRDDISVTAVGDAVKAAVPISDGYYAADSDYLGFYFKGAEEIIDSHTVEFSAASTNINQFGIFHVKDGKVADMKALCESYIATMKERWVAQANYIASEHPKMENAEVRVFGNYVVYVMLTPSDKATVFNAIDGLLKK